MNKIVRLGTTQTENRNSDVYCRIEYADGKLSITGVVGPLPSGNCRGSCGQIGGHSDAHENPQIINFAPGWNDARVRKFFSVWERWHLNDMRAGSPAQQEYLRQHPIPKDQYVYPKSHYEVASAVLTAVGLNPDPNYQGGYKYGSAWLTEAVPDDVIAFLESLPNSDKTPAWV